VAPTPFTVNRSLAASMICVGFDVAVMVIPETPAEVCWS
jgi:hypothetical protein